MTTVLLGLIVLLATALGAYVLGWRTGYQEGFPQGKESGIKESTDKAFAVGYDRGKREQEAATPQSPPPPKPQISPWWIVAGLTLVILVALESIFAENWRVR